MSAQVLRSGSSNGLDVSSCDEEHGELDEIARIKPVRREERGDVGEDLIGLLGH
jgi:hypothetical protein